MSPKLILLVEDDQNLRQSITLILQRAGYLVTETDCAYKAMDLLQSRKYHLVITDINIPDIKSIFLPRALGIFPYVAIVILTDQLMQESENEGRMLSGHYLVKPIAPERLLDCVNTILV
jgi:two-component system, chemotaxis family, chemotaxis protein CheY